MKNVALTLWVVLAMHFAFSQNDTLNQLNAENEKIGWWITYLDKELAKTNDTSEVKYYRYSYFLGKFDYYNMGKIGSKKHPVIAIVENESYGQIPPLDGEYRANFGNGQPHIILKADNGRFTEYLEYHKNGNLKTRYDYTKSCGKSPFEYCIYQYKKNGELKMEGRLRSPGE